MTYKRHQNLREIFQADLAHKLLQDYTSKDLMNRPCNCNKVNLINGNCVYNGECRKKCIVYQATCRICKVDYIGNTQQTFKDRMGGHFNDVQKKVTKGISSDSFADHFAKHFSSKPTNRELREMCEFKIIWEGSPLSISKTFGKSSCTLCMKERLEILNRSREEPKKLINRCSEIYGSCRHKPCFHRFTLSTDEATMAERVNNGIQIPELSQNSKFCDISETSYCSPVSSINNNVFFLSEDKSVIYG